jgi:hypothetical protein
MNQVKIARKLRSMGSSHFHFSWNFQQRSDLTGDGQADGTDFDDAINGNESSLQTPKENNIFFNSLALYSYYLVASTTAEPIISFLTLCFFPKKRRVFLLFRVWKYLFSVLHERTRPSQTNISFALWITRLQNE